jgi:tetratricopeptide (TPR) repeat protein
VVSAILSLRRPFWFWLCAWGVLALAVRLLHVWYVVRALGTAQILDAAYYQDAALSLLGRRASPGLAGEVAFANLGYPYVLSWLYARSPSPTSVLVFQALLGATTAVLTGMAAREAFGRRSVGLWAAGLCALYAPAIFYDGLLLIPSLSAFLGALLVWSLCRAIRLRSWRWCALSGLAIGLAAILRASQLLLLPFALVAINQLARSPARVRWPLLLAISLATASCVVPIVTPQRVASGYWIPLTANGGMNFWVGNHPGAPGHYTDAPFLGSSKGGDYRHALVVERDRFLAEARRRSRDAALSLAASDGFWWRETGRIIAAAPGEWLRVLAQKCRLVVNDYESRTNASFDFMAQVSPVLRWDPLRFGLVAILASLGALECLRLRDRRARWLLATLVAAPVLTCVVFFVSGEYRHAAAPALLSLAAFGIGRLKKIVLTWSVRRVARPRYLLLPLAVAVTYAPTMRVGPAKDRKAYAEALVMPSAGGEPPTLERYALARKLLAQHGEAQEDRLLAAEASLLVESNQAIQFRDRKAAERLIRTSQSLWQEELSPNATLDAPTIERIRRNSVRRVAQLCRQPFTQQWQSIPLELVLLGCHSWHELATLLGRPMLTQAEALLTRALALAPHSVEVLAYRGQLELLRGHDPTPWLERSLAGYPRLALPAVLMAEYAWAERDLGRARQYAKEALKREPSNRVAQDLIDLSNSSASPAAARESPQLLANHVRALLADGRHAQAITVLQEAVRDGAYDEALRYTLGNLMLSHVPPQALIEFFSSRIARDQKPQTSHYFVALGLERMGQTEAGIAELRKALDIDPAHEMSQRQWGLVLEHRGDSQSALEHLVEATRIHPEYRAALEDAARVAERLGRNAEANQWRARARSANPDTPRRFLYWSRYLHEHGRDSAALNEVRRRLAEAPLDAEAAELERVIRAALGKRSDSGMQ